MGIRNVLDKYPYATIGVSALLIVSSVGLIVLQHSAPSIPYAKQAFYSIDDGQTWFADSVDQISPFDYNGKVAVRAYVWKCKGREFVNYLERRTDEGKRKLEALRQRGAVNTDVMQAIDLTALQIKKPGDAQWHFQKDPKFTLIVTPACPNGSQDDLEPVYP